MSRSVDAQNTENNIELQDDIEKIVCAPEYRDDLEGNDPKLAAFLARERATKESAVYVKGQRQSLLIVDPQNNQIGYYDLGVGQLPVKFLLDIQKSIAKNAKGYSIVDVSGDLRHEVSHPKGYDIRFDGEVLGIKKAVLFVAQRMTEQAAKVAQTKEPAVETERANKSQSIFSNGFGFFKQTADPKIDSQNAQTKRPTLNRHPGDD